MEMHAATVMAWLFSLRVEVEEATLASTSLSISEADLLSLSLSLSLQVFSRSDYRKFFLQND
jgi:hypothetical protein